MENAVGVVGLRAGVGHVYLLHRDHQALELHWRAAVALARQLMLFAREAKENESPEIIIEDQGLVMSAGCNIGLSSNPKILKEAYKHAEHLLRPGYLPRKAPPGGITSPAKVGVPSIRVEN